MAEHDSGMGTILTLGLVGVGAYFLYEWLIAPSVAAAPAAAPPGTTQTMGQTQGTTSVSTAPSTTSPGIPQQSTVQQIVSKMQAAGDDPTQNHSVWQWNYYYQQVTGVPGPDPTVVLPGDPNATTHLISISTWWAGMTKAGFSGLGAIARYHAPMTYRAPILRTTSNMLFPVQHPLPYAPSYTLFHGLGGFTAPSGLEKALWGGRGLSRFWLRQW